MSELFMQTRSGYVVDLLRPDLSELPLDDLVVAICRIPRFTGHTIEPYTVAEHSVYCARVAEHIAPEVGLPAKELAWAALWHDAHEAIVQDVSSPLKRVLGETYAEVEARMVYALRQRLSISHDPTLHHWVRWVDLWALRQEREQLMKDQSVDWGLPEMPSTPPWPVFVLQPRGFDGAYHDFNKRMCKLL